MTNQTSSHSLAQALLHHLPGILIFLQNCSPELAGSSGAATAGIGSASPLVQQMTEEGPAAVHASSGRRLLPAELLARSRVTPLIEYGAQGGYVLVCPREGTLPFAPDSQEWFDWLASLTSFRFVGQQVRFTAHRDAERGQRTCSWWAYRTIHQHSYKYYLGTTDPLTLAALEQATARLQAYEDTL